LPEQAAVSWDRLFPNVQESSAKREPALDGHDNPSGSCVNLSAFDRIDLNTRNAHQKLSLSSAVCLMPVNQLKAFCTILAVEIVTSVSNPRRTDVV
jgi:hypothetical protein